MGNGVIMEQLLAIRVVMFTDIVGSTALVGQLGDQRFHELLKTHNIVIREALNRYAGTEVKHTGDGILASFASVSRALECAMAIQRAFAARNLDPASPPIHIRTGLSAGEPVADHEDLFGASVNPAARVCAAAQPCQILVSNVVQELCLGKPFIFSDIGDVHLKGFSPAVRLHEVRWN